MPQKNQKTLVDAFAKIAPDWPEWRLRIIGEGPLRAELARRIVEFLYEEFLRTPSEIPERYFARGEAVERVAADYIAGMTDQFALLTAEGFRPGIASDIFKGRI